MTLGEHIEFWINKSEEDFNTATKMFESGIYDWSLFVAHLALEKILKSAWIKHNEKSNPPKIHNLVTLAKKSNIRLTQEQMKNYLLINNFHLEARYQDYKDDFKKIATKEFARQYLNIIKKEYQWIKSRMK